MQKRQRRSTKPKNSGGRCDLCGNDELPYHRICGGRERTLKALQRLDKNFIYPGYQFKILDGLITNFHLPESTLIMLVSALAGKEHVMAAYEEAVKERYRFFSFGDAMIIL